MNASSVRLARRRILVDDEPRILMSAEVHYFRLHRPDWADRLDKLAAAGCDVVATYMPWLVHETASGEIDLTGATSEYRDLVGFLELAAERGLLVLARPGPFVMAELKNEGIPFRVYRDHPDAVPLGWDGEPAPTRTLDYLEPGYLGDVARWYAAIMPVLAERLVTRGGPVAAVQLDNEVGMLSWVSNTPELTDRTLADLATWAEQSHGREASFNRYGADPGETDAWARHWRGGGNTGTEQQQLMLHHDLGAHHRDRYARYLLGLRDLAIGHGVEGVPFVVNLHGTSAGRGRTFPIGISQLSQAYAGVPQLTSGSDHYLGDLTVGNVPDVYTMNAFMAAVHDADQPLTSLEFEAGTGDYGEDLSLLTGPETAELKTRLCVAQGNRLISYYLFAGGHNPPLDEPVGDGNDRIAFTGERHGFAAPVDPEGRLSTTYDGTAAAVRAVRGAEHLLADMDQVYDDIVLGFVPDHYLTEYCHPNTPVRRTQIAELERYRGMGPRDILARALVLGGYSFGAVDLSGTPTSAGAELDPAGPAVALATPPVLGRTMQDRLAAFVRAGGRLLLHGRVPVTDDDGTPCTVLADALGITSKGVVEGTPHFFPSVRATGWAGDQPEVRVGMLEHLSAPGAETLIADVSGGEPVAVQRERSIVLACDYPCHLGLWRLLVDRLGVRRRLVAEGNTPGLVTMVTADASGQRLVHLLNLAPVPQEFALSLDGHAFGDRITMAARSGLMLPVGVRVGSGVLRWATAELDGPGEEIHLRRGAGPGSALIDTTAEVSAGDATVTSSGSEHLVEWPAGTADERLTIRIGA